MIDLHFHCLPGIDDGPREWDDAVALCRVAAAEGTKTIVATPHVLRDSWINDDSAVRISLVDRLNELLGGHPVVQPGCEYFFSSDAIELWQKGAEGPLTGLNRSSYLLVEFPATRLPDSAEAVFYELSLIGVTPVIAHPERNRVFVEQPQKLERLVSLGALTQITAGSILGAFGPAARDACDEFFKRELVHVVASDAHSVRSRPPQLAPARETVRARWGIDAEKLFFERMPGLIVRNEAMD